MKFSGVLLLVVFFNILFFSEDSSSKETSVDKSKVEKVILMIKIIKYHKDSLHMQYEEEADEWYDATEIEILKPAKYASKLYIYHSTSCPQSSPWRERDVYFQLKLLKKYLEPKPGTSYEIFSDDLELHEVAID